MAIPKEFKEDLRFKVNYPSGDGCPKCNGYVWWESQSGSMAPSWRCACGWRGFDFKAYVTNENCFAGGR